jgi:hypothetical protein
VLLVTARDMYSTVQQSFEPIGTGRAVTSRAERYDRRSAAYQGAQWPGRTRIDFERRNCAVRQLPASSQVRGGTAGM